MKSFVIRRDRCYTRSALLSNCKLPHGYRVGKSVGKFTFCPEKFERITGVRLKLGESGRFTLVRIRNKKRVA